LKSIKVLKNGSTLRRREDAEHGDAAHLLRLSIGRLKGGSSLLILSRRAPCAAVDCGELALELGADLLRQGGTGEDD